MTVKTRGGSPATVAEYRYNGLNWRIAWHSDVTRNGGGDPDGTVDSYDPWYYTVHDTKWRMVAVFRGSDANPKERFVWHVAGLLGRGDSSYIDTVVFRDRDANSGWTSAADGTLEERVYYCQNWRADVSVVMSSSGLVKEWIKYSAYGVPYSITPGDFDADGFLTSNDSDEFDAAYNGGAGAWDARVDLNLDGSLTSADETIFTDEFNNGEAAGLGVLSRSMVANRIGYAGYQHASELTGAKWHVRHATFDSEEGRWLRRNDKGFDLEDLGYYTYVDDAPVINRDPSGEMTVNTVAIGGGRVRCSSAEATTDGCRMKGICFNYETCRLVYNYGAFRCRCREVCDLESVVCNSNGGPCENCFQPGCPKEEDEDPKYYRCVRKNAVTCRCQQIYAGGGVGTQSSGSSLRVCGGA